MIITVTLNPSLDRTVEVDALRRGEVSRARVAHLHPGGKGVNVTRALLTNGVPSRAIVPAAGAEGDQLTKMLTAEQVDAVIVPVSGRTRSNVTIAESDGTVTKINEPGTGLTTAELDVIFRRTLEESQPHGWIVLCGSLPPGVAPDRYATMTRHLMAAGFRVAVDTSGPALLHAIAAGPDVIKPNAHELAEAVGHPVTSVPEVIAAARQLQELGARQVLVSLAEAGAVLVDEGVLVGDSAADRLRSSVGAGDAFLAGFIAAQTNGVDSSFAPPASRSAAAWPALAQALAWGSAAVALPGSAMPGPGDIHAEAVRQLTADDPRWRRSFSALDAIEADTD